MRSLRTIFIALVVCAPLATFAQSSGCVDLAADLAFGDTGNDVTILQGFLKSQGYFSAASVPNFGSATLAAVRAFQSAQGITTTGTVGPLTRAAIKSVSCGGASGSTTASTLVIPTNTSSGAFEISGWLPYWRVSSSTLDVTPHLSEVSEVNPFVYSLKSDGTIVDNGDMSSSTWQDFIAAARAQKVRVVPTIMSGDGALLQKLLSNTSSRIALEDRITALVKNNNFDGIDIDFEGKKAETKDYFSTFLKGLYQRMGQKWVMCTIESRTPVSARYDGQTIPPDAEIYSNDFTQINKYCDRVRIMAYDQQTVDQALANEAASSTELYAPLADPAWVKDVVELAARSISKKKLELGIPTYGYEYDVTAYAGEFAYDILWTFNPGYAVQIVQQYAVAPVRAPWGEMSLSYFPAANAAPPGPTAAAAAYGLAVAEAAETYASSTNSHMDFRYLVWSDAQAIQDKINLAKYLGLRGVSIFKMDGGEDPNMWQVLQGVKQ